MTMKQRELTVYEDHFKGLKTNTDPSLQDRSVTGVRLRRGPSQFCGAGAASSFGGAGASTGAGAAQVGAGALQEGAGAQQWCLTFLHFTFLGLQQEWHPPQGAEHAAGAPQPCE